MTPVRTLGISSGVVEGNCFMQLVCHEQLKFFPNFETLVVILYLSLAVDDASRKWRLDTGLNKVAINFLAHKKVLAMPVTVITTVKRCIPLARVVIHITPFGATEWHSCFPWIIVPVLL